MNFSFLPVCVIVLSCLVYVAVSKDAAQETVSKHGKLSVSGVNLIDQNGEQVQLKGMSLFWSVWKPQYWNKATIVSVHKQCHSNIVRAAMAVEYGGWLEDSATQLQMIETVIEAAIEEDIYVIADWHDWHGEEHVQQAKDFFEIISKKYGSYPHLIYETYNEPIDVSWSDTVKPYHIQMIDVIRANDPDNVILLGTPTYDQRVDEAASDPISGYSNIMYTLHFYALGDKDWLRDRAKAARSSGLPIFVSEYGTCSGSGNGTVDGAETQLWWNWLDEVQISYVNWALSDKEESASVLVPGTSPEDACLEQYLTESGRLIIAQNQK